MERELCGDHGLERNLSTLQDQASLLFENKQVLSVAGTMLATSSSRDFSSRPHERSALSGGRSGRGESLMGDFEMQQVQSNKKEGAIIRHMLGTIPQAVASQFHRVLLRVARGNAYYQARDVQERPGETPRQVFVVVFQVQPAARLPRPFYPPVVDGHAAAPALRAPSPGPRTSPHRRAPRWSGASSGSGSRSARTSSSTTRRRWSRTARR